MKKVCWLLLGCMTMSYSWALDKGLSTDTQPKKSWTWGDFSTAVGEGFLYRSNIVGAGIAGGIVRIIDHIVTGSWYVLSTVASYMLYVSQRGYNKACKRPNPLDSITVQCWHDLVEQVTNCLCDQQTSGVLLLRSMRVDDSSNERTVADEDWQAYTAIAIRIFDYIQKRIEDILPYYEGGQYQRMWLVSLANSISAQDRFTISFLLHEVVRDLDQIKAMCGLTASADDIPVDDMRRIARTTLLLLKKIRILVDPASLGDTCRPSTLTPLCNSSARLDTFLGA